MPVAETWLLPDGVADILPEQAARLEHLRRNLLDALQSAGYQLVFTPLIEYTESLLTAGNADLELVTFKLIDQLSGRLMGIRADLTTQVARIDAHVLPVPGISRYCYAGTVLHTAPQGLSTSRSPLQLGAELYGYEGLAADLEMIGLMIQTLVLARSTGKGLHLNLGHVGLFRSLSRLAALSAEQEAQLTDVFLRKSLPELKTLCQDLPLGQDFWWLAYGGQDIAVLKQGFSATVLADEGIQQAFNDLLKASECVKARYPEVDCSIDPAELRGYHYHTGITFAAYAAGYAMPLAQGGRYDGIGAAYGRPRPATGFSCDVQLLAADSVWQVALSPVRIWAPCDPSPELAALIQAERQAGRVVVQALDAGQEPDRLYSHHLTNVDGCWQIVATQ